MTSRVALLGIAVLLAAACQGSIPTNTRGPGDPSRPGNAGPGGPGSPGGGGSNPGGSPGPGGMTPAPGSGSPGGPALPLPDAGAADGGTSAPGAGDPGCRVTITALNPPRFENLLAGSGSRLRVQARATGAMAPAAPAWQWQVQLGPLSEVTVTRLTPEGDIVEFPLASEGSYTIRASAGPMCTGSANVGASRPDVRMTTYWARVTPPRPADAKMPVLPTHDAQIAIGGTSSPMKVIALSPGVQVAIYPRTIEPRPEDSKLIRSYIRISSRSSSVRFEGSALSLPFEANLLMGRAYDVLIVPEGPFAPVLLADRTANQLLAESWAFDPGLAVTGTVQRTQAGGVQPVADARVFLRADNLLPSSIGQSTSTGGFQVLVRTGSFQVTAIPAPASGLPEARLPEGARLQVNQAASVQLTYAAIDSGSVAIDVRSSDGQRVSGARVRLDADPASLGAIGSFRLGDGPEIAAVGALRAEARTDSAGSASLARLPYGRYRALITPPATVTDAATTVATIEVKAAATPVTVTLARPVKLTGRLLPTALSAGLKLLAIESDGASPGEALSATADDEGRFSLPVAPGRSYRLQIEPDQQRKLPRLFLGPHTAGMTDTAYGEVTLFPGVPIVGRLTDGAGPVPNAVVQIFCTGAPPDCMDEKSPQLESARPLAETRANASGDFEVYLPDPARWDL